jgi:hypothetical protein
MDEAKKKIRFFRSCYETDNRSLQLHSFYSGKVSHALILDDSEVLQGKIPFLPVSKEWGAESATTLSLYQKEKRLYLGAFFIFGHTIIFNKKQKLIAPLLLYPAEIDIDGEEYELRISSFRPILNPAAVSPLSLRDADINPLEELASHLPSGPIGFQEVFLLKELLDGLFGNLHTESLTEFPKIASSKQVEEWRKKRNLFQEGHYYLISAIGAGILAKTRSGRGILNELEELWQEPAVLSPPVQYLLNPNKSFKKEPEIDQIYVPTVLNEAQETLIRKSRSFPINVAIGPPGTGKSFTIAALAIDAISRGESVLIASNNQQAVEVIAQKLEQDFKLDHPPIKTTDKKWKAQVKEYLQDILHGIGLERAQPAELGRLTKVLRRYLQGIRQQEAIIRQRIQQEQKWGRLLAKHAPSFLDKWKIRRLLRRAKSIAPLWGLYWDLIDQLHLKNEILQKSQKESRRFELEKVLRRGRKELQYFLQALRAQRGSLKEQRFDLVNFRTLFKALPVWLVTMEEVHQILPLGKGMFDLVLFDEATQCNIASALPVLQRGKRAVVVGDPKQLRHISFLSRARQLQLIGEYSLSAQQLDALNYREKSLLDFALDRVDDQQYIHFLNEHYRSLPDLIAFSNRKFYNQSLRLMTKLPTSSTSGNLHLHPVSGKRMKAGYNKEETAAILEQVQRIIEKEKAMPVNLCQSIGILSPFREQSDFLARRIGETISLEDLQRHRILIGTPHFFQGEERDVMFLSFTLDQESHASAFRYLEKADVFNVSITRARTEQHLLISFDQKQLPGSSLLREYLSSIPQEPLDVSPEARLQSYDPFLKEVLQALKPLPGDQVYPHYHISGLDIDLVIVRKGKTYGIDLVGYPGGMADAFPLERVKMLDRMGIRVFSVSYYAWYENRNRCMRALSHFLES